MVIDLRHAAALRRVRMCLAKQGKPIRVPVGCTTSERRDVVRLLTLMRVGISAYRLAFEDDQHHQEIVDAATPELAERALRAVELVAGDLPSFLHTLASDPEIDADIVWLTVCAREDFRRPYEALRRMLVALAPQRAALIAEWPDLTDHLPTIHTDQS